MKRLMIVTMLLAGLLLALNANAFPGKGKGDEELHKLQAEAMSLALIHHLQLNKSQRGEIKKILKPLRPEIDEMIKQGETWHDGPMKQRMRHIISDLKAGRQPREVSSDLAAKHQQMQQQGMGLKLKTDKAMKEIMGQLTVKQVEGLENFDPKKYVGFKFLFNPGKLRDMEPVEMLKEIRSMPQAQFDMLMSQMENRLEKKSKQNEAAKGEGQRVGFNQKMRIERHKALVEMMQEVRKMKKVEFEAQLGRLEKDLEELWPMRHRGGPGHAKGQGRGRGHRGGGAGPAFDERGPHHVGPGGRSGQGHGRKGGHHMKGQKLKMLVFSEYFYNAL